ncbi:hypothetical protein JHK84_050441 [Glycine max]|nr:hypothetical protein JHK84_050441 [Glycine max]
MQTKWFGPCRRTANDVLMEMNGVSCRVVGFDDVVLEAGRSGGVVVRCYNHNLTLALLPPPPLPLSLHLAFVASTTSHHHFHRPHSVATTIPPTVICLFRFGPEYCNRAQ